MNKFWVLAVILVGLQACTTSGRGPTSESPIAAPPGQESAVSNTSGTSEQGTATTVSSVADLADEDSVYCRKEKLTGSRIAKVVCMTPSEKDRVRAASQINAEALRRLPGAVPQKN